MCGIFGMISKKEKPFNKRAFCTMGVRNDSRGGDSCGIFIDGYSEYGVDKQKEFINFFKDSTLLDVTTECKVALGHCRKASVGKVSLETAQPVVLYNEKDEADFVVIHNGTIYNYQELAKKYIPEINIEGLTDSQVMARIFYHKGYDCLDEYYGGAVFVVHDYRINQSLVFKGHSRKYINSANAEEERPLFYCWHNGRFIFSSIHETLYAFYYEEDVYSLPHNKLLVIKGNKIKVVKEYNRENVTQSKPIATYTQPNIFGGSEYSGYYNSYFKNDTYCFRAKHDGTNYIDEEKEAMHGVYYVSAWGYVYPNKKKAEPWLQEVGFFNGKMLKHPKAFALINKEFLANNKVITPKLQLLINMLDFNPHSEDDFIYRWYDEENLMIPQGEWKWPMVDWSCVFDDEGVILNFGTSSYNGWVTDYNMYHYNESKVLKHWKKLCGED